MADNQSNISKKGHRARVPVIMQLEALECGAAALAMVMAYYEKWVPLEQVRRDCGVSRNGSNARNMLKAARNYGFDAQGFSCEPDALRSDVVLPCILHWNFNHFVVLTGFRGKYAYINDPARGDLRITLDELDDAFTGICIQITPGPDFEPSGKQKSVLEFVGKHMKGTGPALAFVMLTTFASSLFGIINPAFSRFFLDHLLTGENTELLYPFLGLMILVGTVQIIAGWMLAIYSLRINGKMAVVGSSEYMWKILRLPMDFFSQRMSGDILQRQETNASIASTLVNTIAPLVMNTIMMIVYLVLMLRMSIVLTMIGVATIIINLLVSQIISAKRINITRVQMRDTGKLAAATISCIQMIETIKASGSENGYFQKWSGYQASVNAQNVRYARLNRYLGAVPSALSTVADALVMILGVLLAMQGRFSLGSILMFQGFLGSFMVPATRLIEAGQSIQEMRTDMERVEDVMLYPDDPAISDIPYDESLDYQKLSGEVELKNVTFGYSRLEEPLIRDFSMHIKPGEKIALVGASGCGKSTIAKLISGINQPWSGEVLFDGKPADEIDRSILTGSVAVVSQEIILFDDSIAANIKMWDTSIEDFEMILASRDAQIYDDIMARSSGFRYKLADMKKISDEMMENVVGGTLTKEEALSKALQHVNLKKDQVDLVKKVELDYEHGRKVYEVEFYKGGVEYEFDIDAETGAILDFEKDRD